MIFLIAALGVGWPLLTLSTLVQPDAPFIFAAVLLGLALPALVLTHRQAGRAGVRALLRDCVRLPSRWWWLLLAAFGLPALTWTVGAALGGAQPLTWGLVAFYTADLIIGALDHQHLGGDGLDRVLPAPRRLPLGRGRRQPDHAVFFAAIHLPLALARRPQRDARSPPTCCTWSVSPSECGC